MFVTDATENFWRKKTVYFRGLTIDGGIGTSLRTALLYTARKILLWDLEREKSFQIKFMYEIVEYNWSYDMT